MADISQYKMLDEVEHILTRAGMYLGSTSNTTKMCYVPDDSKMVEEELTYNPALLKMFDEVISNSVDEAIRSGSVDRIEVRLDELQGEITISDNGGIPVKVHPEYDMYIPAMIFGELRTGSNFDDDNRQGAGMNGLGAKLTSVFSERFTVTTGDGSKLFKQTFRDNLSVKDQPAVVSSSDKGTTIQFLPDYDRLGCTLDEDNIKRITKRVYDIAGCNPRIKVVLNGEHIKINRFDQYVGMYTDTFATTGNDDWKIAVGSSNDDTFKQVSFVNGVDTFNGGSHIDYIVNQVTAKLRAYIKKKHKIDVKPNNIKQQLFVFVQATINAPIFTSQTKEYMSSDVKDYGTSFSVPDRFIDKLVKSGVVQKILDWAEAQQRQKELAELRKVNKATQNNNFLKKIVKFDDATSSKRSDCTLYIVEGDSAAKALLSARDPKLHGVYALKGKPLNVRDINPTKLTNNEEFANLMAILGVKVGHDIDPSNLRFGQIVLATDYDVDGSHICGLCINMLNEFWPNILMEGIIHRLKTPIIVATEGKKRHEFFNRADYEAYKSLDKKHSMKYYKGLAAWTNKDFVNFLQNKEDYLLPLTIEGEEDIDCINVAFDKKRADDRKVWLAAN